MVRFQANSMISNTSRRNKKLSRQVSHIPDQWRRHRVSQDFGLPPMRESCAAARVGNVLYVFGGIGAGGVSRFGFLFALDLLKLRWTELTDCSGPLPEPRSHHTLTAVGRNLYLYGGEGSFDGESCTGSVRSLRVVHSDLSTFDTETLTWRRLHVTGLSSTGLNSMPLPRRGHTTIHNSERNELLVFGGEGPERTKGRSRFFSDLWALDLDNIVWREQSTAGRQPAPRAGHTAVLIRHHMFIYGGISAGGCVVNDVQCLNSRTRAWSKVSMVGLGPNGLYSHTALQHPYFPEQMYVFGGRHGHGRKPDARLWVLNTRERCWYKANVMPESSVGGMGQQSPQDSPLASSRSLSGNNDSQFAPTPRYGHIMVGGASQSQIIILGGSSLEGYCNASELFVLHSMPPSSLARRGGKNQVADNDKTATSGEEESGTDSLQLKLDSEQLALSQITCPGLADGISQWRKVLRRENEAKAAEMRRQQQDEVEEASSRLRDSRWGSLTRQQEDKSKKNGPSVSAAPGNPYQGHSMLAQHHTMRHSVSKRGQPNLQTMQLHSPVDYAEFKKLLRDRERVSRIVSTTNLSNTAVAKNMKKLRSVVGGTSMVATFAAGTGKSLTGGYDVLTESSCSTGRRSRTISGASGDRRRTDPAESRPVTSHGTPAGGKGPALHAALLTMLVEPQANQ